MKNNWHDNVFFGLHFDIHATQKDILLGKCVTEKHLIEQFEKIKPDFVQCDCKGHPGVASYPTKIGVAAKGIVKDALKVWRGATKKMGIPLVMHYSGVWDTAALALHPEWGRVDSDGVVSTDNTCPLSDYTDKYMVPQLEEIITGYEVDGFWVDGENWASSPCYCDKCRALFTEKAGTEKAPTNKDEANWLEWLSFSRDNFVDHVRRYTQAIHKVSKTCTSCSNWMYTVRQPDDITVDIDYISGDFAWTWSCANAAMEARFMDSRDKKWDLMAWAFTSYGPMDSWVFKTVPAICQEASVVMSCGGAVTIYDTPNRWGTLVDWHMSDLADVAKFCRARQQYCQDTKSVPQAVIIHTKEHYYANSSPLYNFGQATRQLEGALHLFMENNIHTDIISGDKAIKPSSVGVKEISKYPLCIVPEQQNLTDELVITLKEYVKQGGHLIVTGIEQSRKFEDILGVYFIDGEVVKGRNDIANLSLEVGRRTVPIIGELGNVAVRNKDAQITIPILDSRDAGEFKNETGFLFSSTKDYGNGKVVGIYMDICEKHYLSHYPQMRTLFGNIIEQLNIESLIKVTAPARVCVSVREKNDNLYVNFVNLGCDHPTTPHNTIIENVPDVNNISARIKLDKCPKSVTLAPDNSSVDWSYEQGYFTANISRVGIHDILVVGINK